MAERNSVRTSESRKAAQALGFRSALEARCAKQLDKARIAYEYEPQDFKLEYTTPVKNAHCADCGCSSIQQKHTYLPDFYLPKYEIFLETKGALDSEYRTKYVSLFGRHKNILILFQNPMIKLHKKSKIRYCDWADKNNIPWLSFNDDWIEKIKNFPHGKKDLHLVR